ncbi:chemotaxis protein CheA [Deferrisoma camini]|uniref:chemotaxis protein CheA n=1 Tax=Deferrisoma camini TaxID=1035120 RepID=UPI00046D5234|nr:chemotaxis protein CheA [Deferrisoma camini]
MNGGMERYRKLFLEESLRHLEAAEEVLGRDDPGPQDLEAVFREIHSLKGMAGSMGFAAMAELAHRLEDLLDAWRVRGTAPSPEERELALRACDRLAEMRDDIAAGGAGDVAWDDLAGHLGRAAAPEGGQGADGLRVRIRLAPDCGSPAARAYLILLRFREADPAVVSDPPEAEILQGGPLEALDLVVHGLDRADVEALYETLTEVAGLEFPDPAGEEEPPPPPEPGPVEPAPAPAGGAAAPRTEAPPPDPSGGEGPRVRLPETVQVPVGILDSFVDLLGELTIARSHIENSARRLGSEVLLEEVDRLGRIVRGFHSKVMELRMLPFGLVVGGLRRLVRDQAGRLGKSVTLEVRGEEIGLDKSILSRISDPLVHLVRNALDHGIEPPEVRERVGKPVQARLRIEAERVRNRVEVRVCDDGKGIDVEAVRRRAVELGLVSDADSRSLSPAEIFGFLFRPGFSTREEVSELSGRGVGLDVVKAQVDAMGGTVELTSSPGEGTQVRMSLPLSVAIVPVLLVEVGGRVLALPTASIHRTVEASPRDVRRTPDGHVLLTEKGQVPIAALGKIVGFPCRTRFERMPLVLTASQAGTVALAVDAFLGEQDLFIKPLKGPLRALRGVGGYSVLGDGRLVFLLDPPSLLPA